MSVSCIFVPTREGKDGKGRAGRVEVKRFSEVIEINPRIELIKMKKAFCRNGGVVN